MSGIRERFSTRKDLSDEQLAKVELLRDLFADLADVLSDVLPAGRNGSVALTELESSAMWAIKAVTHG